MRFLVLCNAFVMLFCDKVEHLSILPAVERQYFDRLPKLSATFSATS